MRSLLDRRTAILTAAGCALGVLPGCGAAGPILARVPWLKLLKILILILTNGSAVATVYGEDADGKEQKLEVTLTKEQLAEIQEKGSVTVELKDRTKKSVTPTIEKGN
jgi:hypothetical protein